MNLQNPEDQEWETFQKEIAAEVMKLFSFGCFEGIISVEGRQVMTRISVAHLWNHFDKRWKIVNIFKQVRESAELAAEEQLEETTDRQLEEIDEQMRAWSRVGTF